MLLAKYWTVTTSSVMPWRLRRLRICSMTGLPTIGTMGFGRRIVNGRSLDPSPPAITTAFIGGLLIDKLVGYLSYFVRFSCCRLRRREAAHRGDDVPPRQGPPRT